LQYPQQTYQLGVINRVMPKIRLLFLAAVVAPVSLFAKAEVPAELESTEFSGPAITPCPACLCAAPTGEVFVGVDLLGSLGKGPGKGRVVRLIDKNNDGTADEHTVFVEVDNPRGLISVGTSLYVLHTVIPASTGKLTGMHVTVFEDKDWDGKADGPGKRLISDISPPKHNQDRGADHTTKDGTAMVGFISAQTADEIEMRDIAGGVHKFKTADIKDKKELEISMMPPGLANSLSVEEFASLIDFLASKKQ
jgi:putative heme-binding domain-containing protein